MNAAATESTRGRLTLTSGRSESDHGDSAQTRADFVHVDALRGGLSEVEQEGVYDRTSRKAEEESALAREVVGEVAPE